MFSLKTSEYSRIIGEIFPLPIHRSALREGNWKYVIKINDNSQRGKDGHAEEGDTGETGVIADKLI